ncbi:polysaccharide ABC transporter ATP-binding protein [uncultured Desulfuromonas sp.]|uniref:ABC transporter ATP-binding protein n=1 Tax=uncultured Desulfuromonas sp. TaxID=181013 RepID=UPI002AAC438A|nr:polysaccharide ABC transporter ATP-binding protein [uncultured Desulfuromonas sp.]
MRDEVLVKVENVSKKFCRTLKRSLWYGMQDVAGEMLGRAGGHGDLRPSEFWAVNNVSFELKRGECLGLLGRNGAGKSTLLKMLNGLIKPDRGRITIHGRVGALIELGAGFSPVLTGKENIYVNGAVLGFTKEQIREKMDSIVEFSEIGDFIEMPVQNYSSGMKVRLGFAIAAQMEPDVLIIDEVLAVGDLGFVIKSLNRMAEIIPKSAVIFVSHNLPMVARSCNRALVMDNGRADGLKNVSDALGQYVRTFPVNCREEQGSGEMELVRVGLRDNVQNTHCFDDEYVHSNGSEFFLLLEFVVRDSIVNAVDLFIKIIDQQLREVVDCLSYADTAPFVPENGKLTIELKIPHLFLNGGRYTITVGSLHPENKKVFSRTTNTISFICKAPTFGWAASIIRGEWESLKG